MSRADARRRARQALELRVCTAELKRVVLEAKDPPFPAVKALSVPVIAYRAGVSKRTIYRIIEAGAGPTKTLDLADRVMVALDRSLEELQLVPKEESCRCPDPDALVP